MQAEARDFGCGVTGVSATRADAVVFGGFDGT